MLLGVHAIAATVLQLAMLKSPGWLTVALPTVLLLLALVLRGARRAVRTVAACTACMLLVAFCVLPLHERSAGGEAPPLGLLLVYLLGVAGHLVVAVRASGMPLSVLSVLIVAGGVALYGNTRGLLGDRDSASAALAALRTGSDNHTHLWTSLPTAAAAVVSNQLANASTKAYSSIYLTMRDGTRLAADVYPPVQAGAAPLPVLLHLTRYNRNLRVRFPFSLVLGPSLNTRSQKYIDRALPRGLRVVSVDVRGTGASSGARPWDLHPEEVADFNEVYDWLRAQPWCDGRIVSGGISYDGMAAANLGAARPLSALAVMFSPDDALAELLFPGGLVCTGFARLYTLFTHANEHAEPVLPWSGPGADELPWWYFLLALMTGGPLAVAGSEELLPAAVAEHRQGNWDMLAVVQERATFKDSEIFRLVTGPGGATRPFAARDFRTMSDNAAALAASGTRIMLYAGYYDSASVRGAENLYAALGRHGGWRMLTIGPWTHGARRVSSPWARRAGNGTAAVFDVYDDTVGFLLRGLAGDTLSDGWDNGTVRYYTLGEEAWHVVRSWPLEHREARCFALAAGGELQAVEDGGDCQVGAGAADAAQVEVRVDPAATSGPISRWNLVQQLMLRSVSYANRKEQGQLASVAVWRSAPLTAAMVLTGAPRVVLFVDVAGGCGSAAGCDAAIFVYLEEEVGDEVVYVTEGVMRAGHRPEAAGAAGEVHANGLDGVANRTFEQRHYKALQPGVPERVCVPLEPVSYRFRVGSRLRIAVAGADTDNFLHATAGKGLAPFAERWTIRVGQPAAAGAGGLSGSALLLPVEIRGVEEQRGGEEEKAGEEEGENGAGGQSEERERAESMGLGGVEVDGVEIDGVEINGVELDGVVLNMEGMAEPEGTATGRQHEAGEDGAQVERAIADAISDAVDAEPTSSGRQHHRKEVEANTVEIDGVEVDGVEVNGVVLNVGGGGGKPEQDPEHDEL